MSVCVCVCVWGGGGNNQQQGQNTRERNGQSRARERRGRGREGEREGDVLLYNLFFRDEKGQVGGELLLGGTDPNHYTGDLKFVKLSEETYWQFEMDQ